MPTAQDWKKSGIVPTANLAAWHQYEAGASGHGIIFDYSGNNRHILTEDLPDPALTANVINGQPGWYFDGTTAPLIYDGVLPVRHIFILASSADAVFSTFRGLLSDQSTQTILVGDSGTDKYFDLSGSYASTYRKSNVIFPANNQKAPVGGQFALMEVQIPLGVILDGIQVGQQRDLTARKHKGFFVEQLLYSSIQSQLDRERILLYFNLKFAQQKNGIQLYFPSDDLMSFRRSRFYAEPPQFEKITDSYEFEDGGRTFNEVGIVAPRRWEYDYLNRTPEQAVILDEFYNQARLSQPFIFRDKYGKEHSNVRIENYDRNHDAHMSWKHNVRFKLVKYPNE